MTVGFVLIALFVAVLFAAMWLQDWVRDRWREEQERAREEERPRATVTISELTFRSHPIPEPPSKVSNVRWDKNGDPR